MPWHSQHALLLEHLSWSFSRCVSKNFTQVASFPFHSIPFSLAPSCLNTHTWWPRARLTDPNFRQRDLRQTLTPPTQCICNTVILSIPQPAPINHVHLTTNRDQDWTGAGITKGIDKRQIGAYWFFSKSSAVYRHVCPFLCNHVMLFPPSDRGLDWDNSQGLIQSVNRCIDPREE